MAVEKVVMYRTSDGSVWANEAVAQEREQYLDLVKFVSAIVTDMEDRSAVVSFIQESGDQLRKFLESSRT